MKQQKYGVDLAEKALMYAINEHRQDVACAHLAITVLFGMAVDYDLRKRLEKKERAK